MKHQDNCKWENADCQYRETHEYCPHPEHACTCKPDDVKAEIKKGKKLDEYFPGKGCECYAKGSCECGCNADWTDKEVYVLRNKLDQERSKCAELEKDRDERIETNYKQGNELFELKIKCADLSKRVEECESGIYQNRIVKQLSEEIGRLKTARTNLNNRIDSIESKLSALRELVRKKDEALDEIASYHVECLCGRNESCESCSSFSEINIVIKLVKQALEIKEEL
jgi:predicted RNase H-like nuclease (RuvC/YqgF family)